MSAKLRTTQQVAAALGVDDSTIRQMVRREGLPVAVPGRPGPGGASLFDMEEVCNWLLDEREMFDCIESHLILARAEDWLAQNLCEDD